MGIYSDAMYGFQGIPAGKRRRPHHPVWEGGAPKWKLEEESS
jgi:hypothetical protein